MKNYKTIAIFSFFTFLLVNQSYAQGILLQKENLIYKGAFKVPKGKYGQSTRSYSLASGGSAIGFNPSRNSLFMLGHPYERMVVEISIPNPVISSDLSSLNTAEVLQGSVDPTNGNWDKLQLDGSIVPNGVRPGCFLSYNGKLVGSAWAYYDGNNQAALSHFTASINWEADGVNFSGFKRVGVNPISPESSNGGFVGGYMANIPTEWQGALGGPVITGLGVVPVITRGSMGPSAWVFNPDELVKTDPAPAQMLLGYPVGHWTLGDFSGTSLTINAISEVRGVAFPYGSDSVLFFGRHGMGSTGQGDTCYGPGTTKIEEMATNADIQKWIELNNTKYLCGTTYMDGSGNNDCCYDPADSSKGVHGYPYVYQVWAYDAKELLKVKNGEINPTTGFVYKPWDIKPYTIWNLTFPRKVNDARLEGVTYDPSTQRLFVSQRGADVYGLDPFPLIHVYEISSLYFKPSPTIKIIK